MKNNRYCVIMAGGIGSRFWPLSRNDKPKQFLDILGTGKTFIQATFERFLPLVPAENFVVVTNSFYRELVLEQLPALAPHQVLCEPMRRNTAPCIAYATYHIMASCPDAEMVITPADHLVTNEHEFCRTIEAGFNFISRNKFALTTIGIRPSRPETGYGYIEIEKKEDGVIPVANFREKPDYDTACSYLADGRHLWNSGIFMWSAEGIMQAFRQYLPTITEVFDAGKSLFGTEGEQEFVDSNFGRCPDISIDYGIMEHSDNRFTMSADFGWSDIGTWGSLHEHSQHDRSENTIVAGPNYITETKNCIINVDPSVKTIVQGLDNYLIALQNNALLVCRLADEQRIKEWVGHLEQ